MIKDIDALIKELLGREGGYANNPNDKGGPTNYGITEQIARSHGYHGQMQKLPITTAADIYKEIYWVAPGFDKINSRMTRLAEELFDTGVNMGPQRAAKMLQRALNTLNRGISDYPDILVDGAIGRGTLYSLDQLKAKRSQAETVLLRLVDAQQAVRYMDIAEANQSQEEFMYGWVLNRVGVS